MAVKLFISYSHQDESFKNELVTQLASLKRSSLIETWTDNEIVAGEDWNQKISSNLKESKIILLLVSPDFINSDYCYENEMTEAITRHNQNLARVVPIIIRHCDWSDSPFAKLQILPKGGNPIYSDYWSNRDEAFLNVVKGIKAAINSINQPERILNKIPNNISPLKNLEIGNTFIVSILLLSIFSTGYVTFWLAYNSGTYTELDHSYEVLTLFAVIIVFALFLFQFIEILIKRNRNNILILSFILNIVGLFLFMLLATGA